MDHTTTVTARIAILHPAGLVARGLATVIEEAGWQPELNPADITDWLQSQPPDLVVAVVDDPVLADIARSMPEVPVVAIVEDLPGEYMRAFASGAAGALADNAAPERIVAVIDCALDGHARIPSAVARHLATNAAVATPAGIWLDDAERVILTALAHGDRVTVIADKIGYSERHTHKIMNKLYQRIGASGRNEAIAIASRWGITGQ